MAIDEERLAQEVRAITQGADLNTITTSEVRERVENSLNVTIEDREGFKSLVKSVLENIQDDEEVIPPPKPSRGGGLKTKKYILSPPLSSWIGIDQETRPQVVKRLWDYIKEHKLQDDNDKRRIHLDETLQNIFGIKVFTMFSMQKILSKHLKKDGDDTDFDLHPGDIDYETIAKPDPEKRRRKEQKRGGRKIKKKRRPPGPDAKPNGFKKPIRVSETLREFMGQEMCSRGDVVKKLWDYIKEHDLQNSENRREIICDNTLRQLFDQDTVTSFSMNKYIQPHFLKDENGQMDDGSSLHNIHHNIETQEHVEHQPHTDVVDHQQVMDNQPHEVVEHQMG